MNDQPDELSPNPLHESLFASAGNNQRKHQFALIRRSEMVDTETNDLLRERAREALQDCEGE